MVPREGEFEQLMVFEVNCSLLDLFSNFLGHKGRVQGSFIGSEAVIILKFLSSATRREH